MLSEIETDPTTILSEIQRPDMFERLRELAEHGAHHPEALDYQEISQVSFALLAFLSLGKEN